MEKSFDFDPCESSQRWKWKLLLASERRDACAYFVSDLSYSDPNVSICGALPQDIIDRVILWLPIRSLVRAQSVCKDWNTLICSKRFSNLYRRIPSQLPWLLVFPFDNGNVGLVYDPASYRWFHLSFSFLPCDSRVVATAEGLICSVPKTRMSKVWYVCNPISKSCKELPSPPGLFKLVFLVVGMVVDKDAGSFKIVMAGSELVAEDSEQFILITETYDSTTHCWKRSDILLLDTPLSAWKAVSGGFMYCVTGSVPYGVLAYNIKVGSWSEVRASMPADLTTVRLMDRNGKLLMVGGLGNHGITRDIGVWELQQTGTLSEWKEISWMPRDILRDFLKSLSKSFTCIGQGDLIYFSSKKCQRVLEHNFCQKSWRWIPVSPHLVNPHYHLLRGFCCQPRLHVEGGPGES
eukprot:c19976_g1_i1 orf=146-1366(-)